MRGGPGRGQGRPLGAKAPRRPKEIKRGIVKQIRWTEDEWAEIERCSASANETPTRFQRSAVLARCRKNIT